ncbi:hypothetical protein B0T14DRAFT_32931 [Immersiella caudata]|uniref:Uncharacterized protein n=1 Tax=Immersiella caudata TaxID=314043 RepID=A0AA40CBM0_9PEZI|nr:hypothetical protein B0T14DRAFT_32931 [Immersiella caudata]
MAVALARPRNIKPQDSMPPSVCQENKVLFIEANLDDSGCISQVVHHTKTFSVLSHVAQHKVCSRCSGRGCRARYVISNPFVLFSCLYSCMYQRGRRICDITTPGTSQLSQACFLRPQLSSPPGPPHRTILTAPIVAAIESSWVTQGDILSHFTPAEFRLVVAFVTCSRMPNETVICKGVLLVARRKVVCIPGPHSRSVGCRLREWKASGNVPCRRWSQLCMGVSPSQTTSRIKDDGIPVN